MKKYQIQTNQFPQNLYINKNIYKLMKYGKRKNKHFILFACIFFMLTISLFPIQSMGEKNTKDTNSIIENIQKNSQPVLYDLLIICPEVFSREVQPLIDHKIKTGIKTNLVTIEEVYDQIYWRGRDNAEKMKYFIKDAKEKWNISYVLLIGGRKDQSQEETWWIPVRYSNLIRHYKGHEKHPEGDFLTDLYFADIYDQQGKFSSWDDDNDGKFGEWPLDKGAVDTPDLYAEISVGRLPCRNINEVKNIVNKIIRYETGKADESWFKKIVVIAGDTYPEKTEYIDGEVHTQQAIDIMEDFQSIKIWSSLGNLHWFYMIREINKGCGFVFFSGHGGANSWATHPPYDIDNWIGDFKLKHMNFLHNKNKLPVCLSASGCFNNMFNVSIRESFLVYGSLLNLIPFQYAVPRCWGWNMVVKTNGGSIATIASTGYSYESSDIDSKRGGCEWLDIHFFEEYQQNEDKILGDCWKNTVNRFLQNFSINWNDDAKYGDALIVKNLEQWLLIGDPSLRIGGY
ncbi:hypothetical protein B6U98_00500 [Thermoplasmatales archaeon ex4572_165]|nr:MAG: hypothetical protein B6U98_00500 [Thermoplasmatales archaeon ex4572_165]